MGSYINCLSGKLLLPLEVNASKAAGTKGQGMANAVVSEKTAPGLSTFDDFLTAFETQKRFAFTKINHGFWEAIADVYHELGRPLAAAQYAEADRIARRSSFFEGGFVDSFLEELQLAATQNDKEFHIGLELSAWPGDAQYIGTPFRPERSGPLLAEYRALFPNRCDGLLLKKAVMDGRISELFERLKASAVLIVGPEYLSKLQAVEGLEKSDFLTIHSSLARENRNEIEHEINTWIEQHLDENPVVLLQAGTLAPYWIMRLQRRFDTVRWIDGGLAFSIACPEDLLKRPWGKVYRKEIVQCARKLLHNVNIPEFDRMDDVKRAATQAYDAFPSYQHTEPAGKVSFVERKPIDLERISQFLEGAEKYNRWANRGPAWYALSAAYGYHFKNLKKKCIVPCANGNVALETLMSLHELRAGRRMRWCASSFGFVNTGRGRMSDALLIDCDLRGVLSLDALSKEDPSNFDGVIVTNPFGLESNFDRFVEWCQNANKPLLIDNAAGVSPSVPNLANQSFSLHQTKPYGFGEGGLLVVEEDQEEVALKLLEYSPLTAEEAPYWVGNGKVSELAVAGQLMRLETEPEWAPLYQMQMQRIRTIAESLELKPLLFGDTPAMSLPFLAPKPVSIALLENPLFALGKYYKPLANTPEASRIYQHILNIPCHPDMRHVSRADIEGVLRNVIGASK